MSNEHMLPDVRKAIDEAIELMRQIDAGSVNSRLFEQYRIAISTVVRSCSQDTLRPYVHVLATNMLRQCLAEKIITPIDYLQQMSRFVDAAESRIRIKALLPSSN